MALFRGLIRWTFLAKAIFVLGVFGVMAGAGSVGYFEFAPPERTCLSCHELREPYDRWASSAHREVNCKRCHGGTVTSGWHGAMENLKRTISHFRDKYHDDMHLSEAQVIRVVEQCKGCHGREFKQWAAGGHSTTYAHIFLNEKHNRSEQVAEECLRCHGMFYEKSIESLMTPLDKEGPWRFTEASKAGEPAVPCLACHQIHVAGHPTRPRDVQQAQDKAEAGEDVHRTISLYSRREKAYFAAVDLPPIKVHNRGREVQVSSDPRQRLCTQCHAPNAFGQAGSSDDRTPTGVHEGLSCAACHAPHSNSTKGSCAQCHPKFSHCGLDVTKMDTTAHSPESKHNIHFIECSSCHKGGRPVTKAEAAKVEASKAKTEPAPKAAKP